MKNFEPTHIWLAGDTQTPVMLDGGDVFDERAWTEPWRGAVATYDADDFNADGSECLIILVGGVETGLLKSIDGDA